MHRSATTLATVALTLFVLCSTAAGADDRAAVRGEVTDSSGGLLPGVIVVATAVDGRVLATVVTDGRGGFVFPALPAGAVLLKFELEGFSSAVVALTVQPDAESLVAERLELAALSETVVVHAPMPVARPAAAISLPPLPLPPPRVARPVPVHDRDSICGPAKPEPAGEPLGTIMARRDEAQRGLYTSGSEVTIDGGALNGLDVGQNLVVRHRYRVRGLAGPDATGEHSAGLLQLVTVGERSSLAVVVYACDELRTGDFLAPFKPEPIRPADHFGVPAYDEAARILFADEGQTLGAPRRLMVIDRGNDYGLRPGQRLTLFRRSGRRIRTSDVVGDAVVVAVRTDSSTIRIERVNDAIASGDWAAPQRPSVVRR